MKQLIIIAALALSLASCHKHFENTYQVLSLNNDGHDYMTLVHTSESWDKNQLVYIAGTPFKVMWIESTDLVTDQFQP